ncbi:ankyrin repeat domain-containing protein [Nocardiopsis sediminis]|uniref:Ankyrin repeat domain-containing protein n=1 Tax=Nocardiopsis sediminis TaxID=1778267 RepID=A0ABV8FR42_9ACTN
MSDDDRSPRPADDPDLIELATRLFGYARAGDTAALGAYLDAGVPADLTNDKGDSLIMLAAYHGHAATVARLCASGADADRLNDRGQSPLAGAVFKGEDDVVAVLLDHGADPAAGTPSAIETAHMFHKTHYLRRFSAE